MCFYGSLTPCDCKILKGEENAATHCHHKNGNKCILQETQGATNPFINELLLLDFKTSLSYAYCQNEVETKKHCNFIWYS